MSTQDVLAAFRQLTHHERQKAREKAAAALIGKKPQRKDFEGHTASKYGDFTNGVITFLAAVLLLAAFVPSAMRLFHIGSETFRTSINNDSAILVAGVATVLLAETGQVIFSLAFAVLPAGRMATGILMFSMGVATAIAVFGNLAVATPWITVGSASTVIFAWLEALAPPLLVLGTSYVLKERLLESLQRRKADSDAFHEALAEYDDTISNPEQSNGWGTIWLKTLQDEIITVNRRRKAAREQLDKLTDEEWRMILERELRAEMEIAKLHSLVEERQALVEQVAPANTGGRSSRRSQKGRLKPRTPSGKPQPTNAEWRVINFIRANPNAPNKMTVQELADEVGVAKSTASTGARWVDHLSNDGANTNGTNHGER